MGRILQTFLLSTLLATGTGVFAQDTSTVVIRNIILEGNKKTKPFIIYRELPFQVGERVPLSRLNNLLQQARDQLLNTFLFIDIVPGIMHWRDGALDVVLVVKERWYIFPLPYLKIIDRNFNQWWVQEDHSLQRVDYGIHFSWYNITGRNDKVQLYLENGYNRLASISYQTPYLDKKLRQFLSVGLMYNNTRQINFATDSNLQVFFPDTTHLGDLFIHRIVEGSLSYTYRRGVKEKHTIQFALSDELLSDTINQLAQMGGYAPYFQNGLLHIRYPQLSYTYQYAGVDNIPYPLEGVSATAQVVDKGLGLTQEVNWWDLTLKGGWYRRLWPKTYLALEGQVDLSGPRTQPYSNIHLMGFGDMYLQGLEYYIVDGTFGALGKATVRREVYERNIPTVFRNSASYGVLPLQIFVKAYANVGYAYLDGPLYGSTLNNRLLYTGGVGLDLVTFYDLQLRLEWSFNQLGKNGLFLHNYKGF